MPLYEYVCRSCSKQFEIRHSITEDARKDCPECGKPALERMISLSNFKLSGDGWYKTDYSNPRKSGI